MALQACGRLTYPDHARWASTATGSGSGLLEISGSGHRVGWVFSVPKSGNIDRVGALIGTASSPQAIRLGLYTLDSSGNPTTTTYGGSTYATQASPSANTYYELTLGTPATAVMGDVVAFVLDFDSAAGDLFLGGANSFNDFSFPYLDKNPGTGIWTRSGALVPNISVRYDDGKYGDCGSNGLSAYRTSATYNVNTGGADEYALAFSLPFSARLAGGWTCFGTAAAADFEFNLYGGTTLLKGVSIDGDLAQGAASTLARFYYFPQAVALTAGSTYYLAVRPTTTGNVTYRYFTVAAAGMAASLGFPAGSGLATRVDQGSWSAIDETKVPGIGLILDGLDDGAGGGGGTSIFIVEG